MVVSVAMLYVKTKKNKALYIKLLCIKPLKKFSTIRFFFFFKHRVYFKNETNISVLHSNKEYQS